MLKNMKVDDIIDVQLLLRSPSHNFKCKYNVCNKSLNAKID